jgi:hypothetical protein
MEIKMRRTAAVFVALVLGCGLMVSNVVRSEAPDPRLKGAARRAPVNGWTYVRLEGTPAEIGFQNGYLLSAEIQDLEKVFSIEIPHDTGHDWAFFRDAAEHMLWPHIEAEYREELQGIADGLRAKHVKLDLWDVVAVNAALEWSYYTEQYDKTHPGGPTKHSTAEHCSAFIATGSYTKDGTIVIAHNNWSSYLDGARWTIVFDVRPAKGHRFVMDGLPGVIHSADDFGLNDAGIVITETTISQFSGFDVNGVPEFVRARKAMQYGGSIDEVAAIFKDGNNGGYANDWLIGDIKTNQIASLELGLKHVTLEKKTDGYFVGANFPINPQLAAEETNFDLKNMALSSNARHKRWDQLMAEHKGQIDLKMAQAFLGDHVDSLTGKTEPSERTLCGHIDRSPRGMGTWQPPYGIAGAVQNKATDAALAARMTFTGAVGHACGMGFDAAAHLKAHPEYGWESSILRDLPAYAWTELAGN